jgi:hypothetical protein
MAKTIRLTENDLQLIIRRIISEQNQDLVVVFQN